MAWSNGAAEGLSGCDFLDHGQGVAHALRSPGSTRLRSWWPTRFPPLPGRWGRGDFVGCGERQRRGSRDGGEKGPARSAAGGAPGTAGRMNGPSRPLVLVFKIKSSGLAFQAFWVEIGGKTRQPALGPDAHANRQWACLLGRAGQADRAGGLRPQGAFPVQFRRRGIYLMESLVEIPNFLKSTLRSGAGSSRSTSTTRRPTC